MNKTSVITIVVLVAILLVAAWFVMQSAKQKQQQQLEQSAAAQGLIGSSASDNFVDIEGGSIDLNQYLGRVLVVNSWASWAPASVEELQLLTDVARNYKDEGVVVIGINRAEPKATAKAFLNSIGLDNEVILIVDSEDKYYEAIGGYTMPETIIYDTAGDVLFHKRGAINTVELNQILSQATKEKE